MRITAEQARVLAERARADGEQPYGVPFRHGTLEVGFYAPRGADDQSPHPQDEVYVVLAGSGTFAEGDRRHAFGPGDLLFVPAGVDHRFLDFSDDLAVWVIFYGPEGGEADAAARRAAATPK